MRRFRLIEETFRNTCLNWGYNEVRTPTLEYMHLFTSTGTFTPGLLNKVYSFLDWDGWSGERVVLRPDGTIPIARLYIDALNDAGLAKLFYVTNIFIFEETGTANRERWQGGVELIGADSPLADVELISMAVEVVQKLKLGKTSLKLSHAGIIKALLNELGLSHEEQSSVFDRILDGDIAALEKVKPGKSKIGESVTALLSLKGKSGSSLKNLKSLYAKELPGLQKPLTDFIDIASLLEKLGIDFQIDMDTGRGFEYYTGLIFHLAVDGTEIGGGGRYNALVPFLSGKNIPASGFALYIDRLMEMISKDTLSSAGNKNGVIIKIDDAAPDSIKKGFELVHAIHAAGGPAEVALSTNIPSDCRWTIALQTDNTYILTDISNNESRNVKNLNELLKLIEYEKTDKSSPSQRSSSC